MMRSRGYLLLEMLLALMMASILMLSLGLIIQRTMESRNAFESEARARRLGPRLMETIARDLRNTWVTGVDPEVEILGSWFRGEHHGSDDEAQDEIWFVTSVDSYMRYEGISSDLTEVGYYLRRNEEDDGPLGGLYSLYRREDFMVDKRPDEGGLGVKLHDRVVSFRIRYYDLPRDAVGEEGKLDPAALDEVVTRGVDTERDDWDSKEQERIPYAVRVELVLDVTPIDAFNWREIRRLAVYETLVRLPDFPKIDENFRLLNITAPQPAAQQPPTGQNPPTGNNQNPPTGN